MIDPLKVKRVIQQNRPPQPPPASGGTGAGRRPPMPPPPPQGLRGIDYEAVLAYLPREVRQRNEGKAGLYYQPPQVRLPARPIQPGIQKPPGAPTVVPESGNQYRFGPPREMPRPGLKTDLGMIAGKIYGHFTEAQKSAQESVAEVQAAGQGKYRPVQGMSDIIYNLGQWQPAPGVTWPGKGISAITNAVSVGAQAAGLFGEPINVGAEMVEREGTKAVYDAMGLRESLGVTPGDELKELAYDQAMSIGWSGPEPVKAAYKDAYDLAQRGQLTPENVEIMNAKHGVWWREVLGQVVFDPLNLIDIVLAAGKPLRYAQQFTGAEKMFKTPWVTAAKAMVPVEDVYKGFAELSTRAGQIKEAETLLDKGAAFINPRLASSNIHRQGERIAQVVDIAAGITNKGALADVAQMGLKPGSPEFAAEVSKLSGARFQDIASMWAETANTNPLVAKKAAESLARMGFGQLPQSVMGRRTGVVLRELMMKPNGEMGAITDLFKMGRIDQSTPETIVHQVYEQATKVLDRLIPETYEQQAIHKGAKWASKKTKPVKDALGALYFGVNPGYAARNMYDNSAKALMFGYNPLKPIEHIRSRLGFHVAGAERGIGQAGASWGVGALAQKGEKAVARRVAEQAQMDALKLYWPDALKELGDVAPRLAPVLRDLVWKDAGEIDRLAGLGETAVDVWRHAPDELVTALSEVDPSLPGKVVEMLGTSKSPEEAVVAVRQLMREFAEHAEKLATESKPIGHAIGTATGSAVQLAANSGKVSEVALTKLSENLGELEHALGVARNKTYRVMQASVDPSRWQAMLTKVEGRYNKEIEDIIRRQLIGYAKLEAGEITEAQYTNGMVRIYKEAQERLLKKYNQVINEEEVLAPHLRKLLLQEAAQAQYPSAVMKEGRAVPDAHFVNKIRQLLRDVVGMSPEEAGKITHVSQLTDDQLLAVTNTFRQMNGREGITLEQLYGDLFPKLDEELATLRQLEPLPPTEVADAMRLANSADPQAKMAAIASQGQIPVAPSPSLADISFNAPAQRALNDLSGFVVKNANVKQEIVATELPEFWAKVKSLYTEAHTLAAELGRRNRDLVLLDYNDWRYLDPLMNTIFPWHYWASRSPANWLMAIASRPTPALHYMKLKRELRQYNNNDPSVPAWAKDKIVIHPPGYPGALYWDYEKAFNAVATMYDTFDDPDRRQDAYGTMVNTIGKFGPAVHPILTMAYGAERWIAGDDEGARSIGYLASPTRALANLTGFTLEPWLWMKDPRTGNRTPWIGATKWDVEKATRKLGYEQGTGRFKPEEAVLGSATQGGPAFTEVLTRDIAQYRRWPVFLGLALGLTTSVRQEWENEIQAATQEYGALKEAGRDDEAQALLDSKPWIGTVWFSWENDASRMKMLANNVLGRIGPMPGVNRQALLDSVGLTPELMQQFYDIPNDQRDQMVEWDRRDYEQFTNGIMDLAEIMKAPDPHTIREWREAREQYKANIATLEQKYPNALQQQATYFDMKEMQGDDAAKTYLTQTPQLSAYWTEKNHLMLQHPLVLKYYQGPAEVDQAAESLAWEEVKAKHPDIFETWDAYGQIDDKDWKTKREFRRLHPEVTTAGDEYAKALKRTREALINLRGYTQEDKGAPETTDYIIKGKPNAAQRGALQTIKDMEIEATKPVPLPKEESAKFTPEQKETMAARDKIYADAVAQFPDLPRWEREYEQIKYLYGEEAASLYGQKSGLYQARDVMSLAEIGNPALLREMDDKSVEYAAKSYMRYDAEKQWPGIFKALDEYYALPPKGNQGNNRHEYRILHPELAKYWEWKNGAPEYYQGQLMQQRTKLREEQMSTNPPNPESIRDAIGMAESGGDYVAQNPKSSASGKYQYIESTWGGYGGYATAKEAPPEVQDQRALEDVQASLEKYQNDPEKVIAAHYYPKWADDKSKWDTPPVSGSPTIRQYVDYVMNYLA